MGTTFGPSPRAGTQFAALRHVGGGVRRRGPMEEMLFGSPLEFRWAIYFEIEGHTLGGQVLWNLVPRLTGVSTPRADRRGGTTPLYRTPGVHSGPNRAEKKKPALAGALTPMSFRPTWAPAKIAGKCWHGWGQGSLEIAPRKPSWALGSSVPEGGCPRNTGPVVDTSRQELVNAPVLACRQRI